MMTIEEAQRDMRRAFAGGGPGVLVSGLVWLTTALVFPARGTGTAFAVLFFGGMLIFPLSTLLSSHLFRRAKAAPGNPLGRVALESTIAMIGGLFAAWLFLPLKPALVFPLAAVAVGTHYAAFRSVYGDMLFWALAAAIIVAGLAGIYATLPGGTILAVALIELLFAAILIIRARREG